LQVAAKQPCDFNTRMGSRDAHHEDLRKNRFPRQTGSFNLNLTQILHASGLCYFSITAHQHAQMMAILGISGAVTAIYRYFAPLRRGMAAGRGAERRAYRHPEAKIGRNDPCPCGSGKKYKHCCGQASL
jgi:hypothetical protein